MTGLDETDRRLVIATQAGLPLVREPYAEIASRLGLTATDVMARVRRLLECGAVRRIGAVPNHYALGYRANGMSVWDVDDASVRAIGRQVGALDFVSHCYLRPRHLPLWPYNLFAMIHGRSRDEVLDKAARVADLVGEACRGHTIIFSRRILKKTGLRLAG
jgi:DNA-binding Lrp family transcriptional regulator